MGFKYRGSETLVGCASHCLSHYLGILIHANGAKLKVFHACFLFRLL